MLGTVFDIKEFSVYDGPGVRITVFLKGCPLRCQWCHNPEGFSPYPEIMVTTASCLSCGLCKTDGCSLTGGVNELMSGQSKCVGCGRCTEKCPNAFRKVSGKQYTPKELADVIMKNADFLQDGGGVTFSGGEPTMQADFLLEVMALLPLHKSIQTCGQCNPKTFKRILDAVDFLFFDIKHTDPEKHKEYTGVSNETILRNLESVKASGTHFIARIPLVRGVNDDRDNLKRTAELLKGAKGLIRVELLPYNAAAGAKYSMTGKRFTHSFEAPDSKNFDITPFKEVGIECKIM